MHTRHAQKELQTLGAPPELYMPHTQESSESPWLDPKEGIFELTKWKEIALQWHKAKAHRSKRE